jgi:amylosucrase
METAVRRRAADALQQLLPSLTAEAVQRLGHAEAVAFLARLETQLLDIYEPLDMIYGEPLLGRLVRVALDAAADRPAALRERDRKREIDRYWYQRERMVGYVCYTDRFAGTLTDVAGKLDYLDELGVRYLHLMPLLRPRPGENDGGYAVMDYRSVDPRLGSMDDLSELAGALRERDMSLCVDLVLNHTAQEHPWARAWLAGEPAYRDFYLAFPDREMPMRTNGRSSRCSRTARPAPSPGTTSCSSGCGPLSGATSGI